MDGSACGGLQPLRRGRVPDRWVVQRNRLGDICRGRGLGQVLGDEEVDRAVFVDMGIPMGLRWVLSYGLGTFKVKSISVLPEKARNFSLQGLKNQIQYAVCSSNPIHNVFFIRQPEKTKGVLGDRATLMTLTQENAADVHCPVGAQRFVSAVLCEWFED
ncbi:hypothetical protein F5Y15DRAFT_35440 [Xylariaceae sp. FL0016]|nr:hypothetical protein F5Y15DRAFT_35440 [Xylariaceae sp. FL0016]